MKKIYLNYRKINEKIKSFVFGGYFNLFKVLITTVINSIK